MHSIRSPSKLLVALLGAVGAAAQAQKGIPATNYIIESNPNVSSVSLEITTQDYSDQNYPAPYLYGLMHEDISHSGDGGIYAELLINRAFQGMCLCHIQPLRFAQLDSAKPGHSNADR